jgi:hypothetical protein
MTKRIRMKNWVKLTLLAIFLLAVTIRLFPLLQYQVWGSDTGEYHSITTQLISDGYVSTEYDGWGFGYPYFPGMYYICASVHFLTGIDPLVSLMVIIPLLASLSVLITFYITKILFKSDVFGLIASGFIAVAMPHVFPTSHPMPGSIGDLFFITCLLLFILSLRAKKFALLLVMTSIALLITHHLSLYFLFIFLIGALLFQGSTREMKRKSIYFSMFYLFFLYTSMLIYWFVVAEPFGRRVIGSALPISSLLVAILGYISLIVLFIILIGRERIKWRFQPRYPRGNVQVVKYLLLLFVLLIFIISLMFSSLPGTDIQVGEMVVILFLPFLILCAFGSVGPGYLRFYKGALAVYGWVLAGLLSAVVGIITSTRELLPYRHTQYLMLPLAILIGVGAGMLIDLLPKRGESRSTGSVDKNSEEKENSTKSRNIKRVAASIIIIALICMMTFSAYPSKEAMSGFQEGTTEEDMRSIHWLRNSVPEESTIATDHRMSSMVFGFAELNATWDSAYDTLHSPTFEGARAELEGLETPSGMKRIDYVLLTDDIKSGAALLQWEEAEPMSPDAQNKFENSPFIRIYGSEKAEIYLVGAF